MLDKKIAIQLVGAAVGTALTFAWDKLRDDSPTNPEEDKQVDMWDVPGFQEAVYAERLRAWKESSDRYAAATARLQKKLRYAEGLLEMDDRWNEYNDFINGLYMDEWNKPNIAVNYNESKLPADE